MAEANEEQSKSFASKEEAAVSAAMRLGPPAQNEEENAEENDRRRKAVYDWCATELAKDKEGLDAYDEALRESPEIVRIESDPLRFFEVENGDVPAAGRRLFRYWKHRKDRLGAERYYRPLDLSEDGALDVSTIAAVAVGFLAFLPDDSEGRTVLYFDHALATQQLDGLDARYSRIRAEFYMLHQAMLRNKPLRMIRYSESFQIDKAKMHAFEEYWTFAPFTLDSVYFAYRPPPGAMRVFKATVAPLVAQHLSTLLKTVRDHKTFFGNAPEDLYRKIAKIEGFEEARGLRDKLPAELGGAHDALASHSAWYRRQQRRGGTPEVQVEEKEELDSKPPAVQRLPSPSFLEAGEPRSPPPSHPSLAALSVEAAARADSAESICASEAYRGLIVVDDRDLLLQQRRHRKRKKDLAYSRERRRREKEEMDSLQEQVKALSKTNDTLRQEEARLAILLVDAQNCVAEVAPTQRRVGAGLVFPPGIGAGLLQNAIGFPNADDVAPLLPGPRGGSLAAGTAPSLPANLLMMMALEEQAQQQQKRRRLEQVGTDTALLRQRLTSHLDTRELLLQRLGATAGQVQPVPGGQLESPRNRTLLDEVTRNRTLLDEVTRNRTLLDEVTRNRTLLDEVTRNQTLFDELVLSELSHQRRVAAVPAAEPDLVQRLLALEEQAAAARRARDAAQVVPWPAFSSSSRSSASLPEDSKFQLLRLLRSTQGPPSAVAPPLVTTTPPFREEEALLLSFLASRR